MFTNFGYFYWLPDVKIIFSNKTNIKLNHLIRERYNSINHTIVFSNVTSQYIRCR